MRWAIDHSSREALPLQIVACVRRGVASGELAIGEQLPPAAELAGALSVDRNTVLAAYRQLRDEGLLEFRRGRGGTGRVRRHRACPGCRGGPDARRRCPSAWSGAPGSASPHRDADMTGRKDGAP